MSGPLKDPGDPADPTILGRIRDWYVKGEQGNRLALHVHGDEHAWAHQDELVHAVASLNDSDSALTIDELSDAVRAIGTGFGLKAYASEAKCAFDALKTILDTSFYAASPAKS